MIDDNKMTHASDFISFLKQTCGFCFLLLFHLLCKQFSQRPATPAFTRCRGAQSEGKDGRGREVHGQAVRTMRLISYRSEFAAWSLVKKNRTYGKPEFERFFFLRNILISTQELLEDLRI